MSERLSTRSTFRLGTDGDAWRMDTAGLTIFVISIVIVFAIALREFSRRRR